MNHIKSAFNATPRACLAMPVDQIAVYLVIILKKDILMDLNVHLIIPMDVL